MALRTTSITKVYPMDSDQHPTIDNKGVPVYDREYHASDLREVMRLYATDGVCTDYLDELEVSRSGASWSVGAGACVADGLLIPVRSAVRVLDQSDIASGSYAWVIVAARFDSAYRDGAVYARVTQSPSYEPVRTESTWELVLARVDWRGTLTDHRLDPSYCGAMAPVLPVDTDSFVKSLETAVSQFELNVGEVDTLPSGTAATVHVRKPAVAGEPVVVDFGIPRGAPGANGVDADSNVTFGPDAPPKVVGAVWFHEPEGSKVVDEIRVVDTLPLYPGGGTYPGPGVFPGGNASWVAHKLSSAVIDNS